MAGLLYKDFMAVKGKMYVIAGIIVLLLAFLLRIAVPVEEADVFMLTLCICVAGILYVLIVAKLEVSVLSADEGRKQKQYYLSLPVSIRQYVASKYLFLLLAFYVAMSVSMLIGTIGRIHCGSEEIDQMIHQWMALVPVLACVFLLIPAIELPFLMAYGVKKGGRLKTGFLISFFFLGIVYLMFGDLSIFDEISVVCILKNLAEHQEMLLILQVLVPYITLGLYYLSYRISCRLFGRKEWGDD